jgi:WD40 repeat protein
VQVTRRSDGESIRIDAGFATSVSEEDDTLSASSLSINSQPPRLSIEGCYVGDISLDGKTLAATNYEQGHLRLWDLDAAKPGIEIKAYTHRINALAFSPDSKELATGAFEESVKLWDCQTGHLQADFGVLQGSVVNLAFSPDGKTLTALSRVGGSPSGQTPADGSLTATVWDLKSREPLLTQHFSGYRWALSNDGKLLALASVGSQSVSLWDVSTGQTRWLVGDRAEKLFSMAITDDGQTLVLDDSTGMLTLRTVATGDVLKRWQRRGARTYAMTFSPDGSLLAAGQDGGSVLMWNINSPDQPTVIDSGATHCYADALAFTPDGKELLTLERRRTIGRARPASGALHLWGLDSNERSF